ncbi:hypothetical protein AHF37_06402 [Paragonimus kellicotti]|nr:hypothetical protein AHF37_06402 [Paragonimus kellicotti]
MDNCPLLTDTALEHLGSNCRRLQRLDLYDYTTLAKLAVHCPHLNNLILSHCDQITDEGIARLAEGLCGPDQLQELAMDNCPLLTDTALEHLGSNCRRLQRLDLYDFTISSSASSCVFRTGYPTNFRVGTKKTILSLLSYYLN